MRAVKEVRELLPPGVMHNLVRIGLAGDRRRVLLDQCGGDEKLAGLFELVCSDGRKLPVIGRSGSLRVISQRGANQKYQ